jgi:sugar (pentulose or hexulose) kinase
MDGGVVVLDVGKTNVKVLAFDSQGNIVAERSRANGPLPANSLCPYLHLDTEDAWTFLIGALREIAATVRIDALSISTHGAAGVLVDDAGFVLPPMDYEWEGYDVAWSPHRSLEAARGELLKHGRPHRLEGVVSALAQSVGEARPVEGRDRRGDRA